MLSKIARLLFVLACALMGSMWADYILQQHYPSGVIPNLWLWRSLGAGIGCVLAGLVLFLLTFITQEIYDRMMPALIGVVVAMGLGYFIGRYILLWLPEADLTLRVFVQVSFVLIFCYMGISLGLSRASRMDTLVSAIERRNTEDATIKLLDTSTIIDGRIADVCETGFVEGTLWVPRFVLQELQHIADSPDIMRRAKGRHGLDILNRLQGPESRVKIEIIEEDPPNSNDVDGKLVVLARKYQIKIFTNDFNLNKVAKIEGIHVLNINDLANALKPMVLPDERMEVKIIKEGREPSQGVGYLDDGTMVVVDGGRTYLNRTVEVLVTSVLQTAAGRMIFTRFNSIVP